MAGRTVHYHTLFLERVWIDLVPPQIF